MVARSNAARKSAATDNTGPEHNARGQEVTVDKKYPTDEEMRKTMPALSQRIRHLHAMGMSMGDISRHVKRENGEHPKYQHVRNVLLQPLKGPTKTDSAGAERPTGNAAATDAEG
ncbi:hypothetical protein [Parvimonas sp. M13]|uniref:hypothetical protein n=1 Tax=Parvimonas sp. M13 TaxID=3110694 RepID=UPI002B4A3505|nr:hypothetical protein [Parvimonas sp. M13]MEB3025849.1 hypothetical protein [Parvimonas sp. M13]